MPGRVAYLDGIRALAIAAVLCTHWIRFFAPIGRGGYIGVDIFFVLSGFIITSLLWSARHEAPRRFYAGFVVRRVRRLYPALLGLVLVVTVAALLMPQALPPDREPVRGGFAALGQLTWLLAALQAPTGTLGHTWTLGLEWLYYLAWPAVIILLATRRVTARRAAGVTAVLATLLYAGSLALDGRLFYYLPPARVAELLAGSALALALRDEVVLARARRTRAAWPSVVAFGAIALYILFAPKNDFGSIPRLVGLPVAIVGTLCLIWWGHGPQRGPVGALLTHRRVTWLGACSYSLYLWHTQAQHFIERDWLPVPTMVIVAIALALTAGLTAVSYVVLERPFLRPHSSALAPAAGRPAARRSGREPDAGQRH